MIDVTKLTNTVTETITTAAGSAVEQAKQFDVTKLDVTKLDVTKLDVTKLDLTKLDLSKMANVEMPKFERPQIDVPAEVDRVADLVRDVTYAGIGVWVMAAEKVDAEVRRLVAKVA